MRGSGDGLCRQWLQRIVLASMAKLKNRVDKSRFKPYPSVCSE